MILHQDPENPGLLLREETSRYAASDFRQTALRAGLATVLKHPSHCAATLALQSKLLDLKVEHEGSHGPTDRRWIFDLEQMAEPVRWRRYLQVFAVLAFWGFG